MTFASLLAGASMRDRLVALLGATIGIALTIVVCTRLSSGAADPPVIVAPLGASAVLVFAVPASPLAQPWPVIGGNVISTLIGVAAFHLATDPVIAAAAAVGAAILVMSLCRCLHPPGGAAALTAVIGSQGIHAAGYGFAFAPVALNSIMLVAVAMAFHRATGHSYPHRPATPPPVAATPSRFDASDLDAALADMHDSFDIARADLDALLAHAERHAAIRAARS